MFIYFSCLRAGIKLPLLEATFTNPYITHWATILSKTTDTKIELLSFPMIRLKLLFWHFRSNFSAGPPTTKSRNSDSVFRVTVTPNSYLSSYLKCLLISWPDPGRRWSPRPQQKILYILPFKTALLSLLPGLTVLPLLLLGTSCAKPVSQLEKPG